MLGSLRVDDPERRFAAVRLCSDLPLPDRDFVRDNGGWVLRLPETGVSRLEYQLEVLDHDGTAHVVCDPDNPSVRRERSARNPSCGPRATNPLGGSSSPPCREPSTRSASGCSDSVYRSPCGRRARVSCRCSSPTTAPSTTRSLG